MKICLAALFLVSGVLSARADLEIVVPDTPQIVFAGTPAAAALKVRNPDPERREQEFSIRLVQLSSSIAMPIGETQPWKKIEVLAGQTVVESVPVTLPEVRAATSFRIEVSAAGRVVARLPILGCPREMLKRLAEWGGETPVGVYDRDAKLKPMLQKAEIPFTDLEPGDDPAAYRGRVAILGPFASEAGADWKDLAGKLAGKGVAVVVLLPQLRAFPFSEAVREGSVVVARGVRVDDLAGSAAQQLALLRLVELALTPTVQPAP
jgi:hypothetical protein